MTQSSLLELLSLRDVADIAAVAIILYNLLLLIRGTRAVQILLGILVLLVAAYLARVFELKSLEALLQGFGFILPFAAIVLFQSQIRRALVSFGKNPLFGLAASQETEAGFQEVVIAATTLSARRVGALIVIERAQGLRDYAENGIILDAQLSYDLLVTIFNTASPLHDGAVIIQNDRIAAAATFLPLSSGADISHRFGTRHRAALGISDETDAIAVVVSEENGNISIAVDGKLIEKLDARRLRNLLFRYLVTDVNELAPPTKPLASSGAKA